MRVFVSIALLLFAFLADAQRRPERVSGTYRMVVESYMSQDQARAIALEQARLQAMADEFGTQISQSTQTRIETSQGSTETRFSTLANSFVNGVWVEDVREPEFEFFNLGAEQWISCSIVGMARRVVKASVDFEAKPLKCLDLGCETQDFNDGEPLFFYFKSPVDGFLSIYLDDGSNCQMLLPYQNMSGNTLQIEADREYFLFRQDPKYNYTDLSEVEEYELFTEAPDREIDMLYVIFSTEDYYKPNVRNDDNDGGTDSQKYDDYPKFTDSRSFREWLNRNLTVNENLFLKVVDITISK